MRTIWNGILQLGEIAIPVALAPTVRDRTERFRKLHEACSTPVKFRSWCESDEQLLEQTDLVSAYEVAPGEFLVLTDDEIAALEPEESRAIPIAGFITIDELDPLQVRKRYRLVPSKSIVGRRGYALLAAAIAELQVAALVRFTAWSSEQLGAITARPGPVLELAMLHFAEDIVPADEISAEILTLVDVELRDLALELVRRHTRPLRVDDLASRERPRVRELLEAKLAGEKLVRPEPADQNERPPVVSIDLEGALKRSIKTAPRRRAAAAR